MPIWGKNIAGFLKASLNHNLGAQIADAQHVWERSGLHSPEMKVFLIFSVSALWYNFKGKGWKKLQTHVTLECQEYAYEIELE